MHQHQGHKKNLYPKFETVITHPCMVNKTPKLVCDFSKPLAVICELVFTMHRGVEKIIISQQILDITQNA